MLGADEVHVWLVDLRAETEAARRLERTLSDDEIDRADRFRSPRDRHRFVVSHGALRQVIGRYLGVPPAAIRFDVGRRGKPSLDANGARAWLRFNLAHSGDLALCALAREREVGVDVEAVRDVPEMLAIAERYFAPGEVATLCAAPAGARRERFFALWTLKEAYVKARGDGLGVPLASFDVSKALQPGGASVVVDPNRPARYELRRLRVGDGYAAALALAGNIGQVELKQFEVADPSAGSRPAR